MAAWLRQYHVGPPDDGRPPRSRQMRSPQLGMYHHGSLFIPRPWALTVGFSACSRLALSARAAVARRILRAAAQGSVGDGARPRHDATTPKTDAATSHHDAATDVKHTGHAQTDRKPTGRGREGRREARRNRRRKGRRDARRAGRRACRRHDRARDAAPLTSARAEPVQQQRLQERGGRGQAVPAFHLHGRRQERGPRPTSTAAVARCPPCGTTTRASSVTRTA